MIYRAFALAVATSLALPAFGWDLASESPFGVACPLPGMRGSGIKWCRVGAGATQFVNWPEIEKAPGVYDWAAADRELRDLNDPLDLSLLPILGYSPKWASTMPDDKDFQFYPPKDVAMLSRFVRHCVTRYHNRVNVWEVWNEPANEFFRGTPAEYSEMVMATGVAARQADPNARIAMGCAGVDLDFIERLFEFGCGPYFDVLSVHPYQWGRTFNDGWMIEKLESCRKLMDRYGHTEKPIWITEYGWSLADGVTPAEQADLLVQGMVTALSVRERLKVEKVFWFCVKDWGGPGFGLFDERGQAKPAFDAYKAVTAELTDANYVGSWKKHDDIRGHVFLREDKPVLVLWRPSPEGKTQVEIGTSAPKLSVRTVENVLTNLSVSSKLVVEVTHAPIFITGLTLGDLNLANAPGAGKVPATRQALSNVWFSVVTPSTTARPYFVLGASNDFQIKIHNDSSSRANGKLLFELSLTQGSVVSGTVPFESRSNSSALLHWQPTLPLAPGQAGQLARLKVRREASDQIMFDVPVRLTRLTAIEFAANTWVEHQYLHNASKSGAAESVRFGDEFGYRFTLPRAGSAQLRVNAGANGAQPWALLVSTNGENYVTEKSGKAWPVWQTIALDKYLPKNGTAVIYFKIQGKDCQVREVILETGDQSSDLSARLAGPERVIALRPGIYHIDHLTIPPDKKLVGVGGRPVLQHVGKSGAMITLSSGAVLENVECVGSWAPASTNTGVAVMAGDIKNARVRDVRIRNFAHGIRTDHTGCTGLKDGETGLVVDHCTFQDLFRAMDIINSRHINVISNHVENIQEQGLQFWGFWDQRPDLCFCSDLSFIGNTVTNVVGGAGIWGSYGERVLFASNTVSRVGDMCLDLENCRDSVIRDNIARSAYYGCIGVYFKASNIVVSRNQIVNDRPAPADTNGWWVRAGVWLNDSERKDNITIISNNIVCAGDMIRRAVWIPRSNVNGIVVRANQISGASNWWGDTVLPHASFQLTNGSILLPTFTP